MAQAQSWQMAMGFDSDNVYGTASDASGNIYLTGIFQNTITLGTTQLVSAGNYDIFVAKWSPTTNTFVWALRAGGTNGDYGDAIAVSGNAVYIAGRFLSSPAAFGGMSLSPAGTPHLGNDVFVAKLTDTGTSAGFTWVQRCGSGDYNDEVTGLAANGTSVYLTGVFGGPTALFGNITLTNSTPSSPGNAPRNDGFVAKISDDGPSSSFAWALNHISTSTSYDWLNGLAVNGTNVYVRGVQLGNAGPGSPGAGTFVAKLIDGGNTMSLGWVQPLGNLGIVALAANTTGVVLHGIFFGTLTLGSSTVTSAGGTDVLLVKLADTGSTGSVAWVQQAGGSDNEDYFSIGSLAVRGNEIYAVGSFRSATATFGTTILTQPSGNESLFVTKLTDAGTSGRFLWAQQGGNGRAYAMALSGANVFVGGRTYSASAFGSFTITVPTTFLASISDATALAAAQALTLPGIRLYPNPARARATVQLPPVPGAASAALTLLDALGRTVRRATVNLPAAGLRHELDLTGLPAGLYAVQVAAGDRTATQRLVVE